MSNYIPVPTVYVKKWGLQRPQEETDDTQAFLYNGSTAKTYERLSGEWFAQQKNGEKNKM